jgi:hypothetical protein
MSVRALQLKYPFRAVLAIGTVSHVILDVPATMRILENVVVLREGESPTTSAVTMLLYGTGVGELNENDVVPPCG